ncbi:AMP-dependent synthetase/ligase [Stenomitos frigidus]|uniref:Long-chain fatty acid--CoA ligase n=1 Tax=Stenomitos frigidus ULC18 TaxID=2107698 RepID=A0A2T1ED09_9CYAN|nr:AMP-binding protein [Stenomitos frigidus]PSB30585.1 long-chain fatty acid--CoA ligase [Stenomitos frigidus ULC18]
MNRSHTLPMTEQERQTLSQLLDYSQAKSLPEMWAIAAQRFSQNVAVYDPHAKPIVQLTYAELYQQMQQFAAGLQALGVKQGDHVALFADNSPHWLIADQGMMGAGAVNAVRGSQADRDELLFILKHSDSKAIVVQDQATLKKLAQGLETLPLQFIVTLTDEPPLPVGTLKSLNFSQLMELGAGRALQPVQLARESLATLMYTSGTSGRPKGVMLSHSNLLAQISGAASVVNPQQGRVLSILPIWHCYERTFEYFIFAYGCAQAYTNIRHVKKDLKDFKPNYMVAVPRLWESIYEGVQKQFRDQPPSKQRLVTFFFDVSHRYIAARRILHGVSLEVLSPSIAQRLAAALQAALWWLPHRLGDRLVYRQVREGIGGEVTFLVSGGGSIAEHLEDFFEIIGVAILGGYGLTETAPITHVRRPWRNIRGGDGQPLPQTETRIVDPETRKPVPLLKQGLVLIRGAQVMQGYYKNPEATAKAIDPDGWFDTGDLGWVTDQDDLIITGRAKDTIVLTSGENIEPQPIEDACLRSPYIDQIMLVGQDQKLLGALIVPNLEALQKWAVAQNMDLQLPPESAVSGQPSAVSSQDQLKPQNAPRLMPHASCLTLDSKPVQDLIRQELNREVQNRPGYRADDRVGLFRLLPEPFSIENGMLTQTLKIRRNVVTERYHGMINEMFVG